MFTCELKINGNMIIHIYGHNEGNLAVGYCLYKYEVYEFGRCKEMVFGEITHLRDNGLLELVRLIIEDYQKKDKK